MYFSRFPNHAFTLFWLLYFHPIGANLSRCPFCVSFGLRWVLCLSFRPVRTLTYCAESLTFGKQHARPVFPLQIGFAVSLSLSRFLLSFISQSVQPFAVFILSRCPCVFRNSLRPLFRFPVFLSGVPFGCWWFPFFVPVSRWFLAFGLGTLPVDLSRRVSVFAVPAFPFGVFLLFHACAVVVFPKTAAKVLLYLGGLLECLKKIAFSL